MLEYLLGRDIIIRILTPHLMMIGKLNIVNFKIFISLYYILYNYK